MSSSNLISLTPAVIDSNPYINYDGKVVRLSDLLPSLPAGTTHLDGAIILETRLPLNEKVYRSYTELYNYLHAQGALQDTDDNFLEVFTERLSRNRIGNKFTELSNNITKYDPNMAGLVLYDDMITGMKLILTAFIFSYEEKDEIGRLRILLWLLELFRSESPSQNRRLSFILGYKDKFLEILQRRINKAKEQGHRYEQIFLGNISGIFWNYEQNIDLPFDDARKDEVVSLIGLM